MGKSKSTKDKLASASTATFTTAKDSLDPALASLFATSSGPVNIQSKAVQPTKLTAKTPPSIDSDEDETSSSGSDAASANGNDSLEDSLDSRMEAESSSDVDEEVPERPRKRRRVANGDTEDLEEAYFKRLGRQEEKDQHRNQADKIHLESTSSAEEDESEEDGENGTSSSDGEDNSASKPSPNDIPQHESLERVTNDADKLKRTVFLGNVSTEAIKSKTAKKALTSHLRSVLKTPDKGKRLGKFESVRFRSTAYVSGSGPKKATFAKKELMDTTTKSGNAYAVFTTEAAAKLVSQKLNGSVILDRHLRVDWLGQPRTSDHRRCVFVGNLSFVDEEAADNSIKKDDAQSQRPKGKNPADPEEGLWRTFGKVGKIENVRVVRDQETRVSKGFAYVQFTDENSVEAALLLNEKKFPPMLPRKLRVMRAKKMRQKAPSLGIGAKRKELKASSGGRAVPFPDRGQKRKRQDGQYPKSSAGGLVFEGHRATSGGTSKGKPAKLKRHSKRPTTRSSRRGAAFKAAGGRNAKGLKKEERKRKQ